MEKVAMTYIIDDDKIFVYVLKKVMEKNIKFKEIKEFRNGEEVLELITSGPYEKNNIKYFETLEKVTGITKTNFNSEVWKLINNEK